MTASLQYQCFISVQSKICHIQPVLLLWPACPDLFQAGPEFEISPDFQSLDCGFFLVGTPFCAKFHINRRATISPSPSAQLILRGQIHSTPTAYTPTFTVLTPAGASPRRAFPLLFRAELMTSVSSSSVKGLGK